MVVLLWIILTFCVMLYAGKLGRGKFPWFLVSLFLSPVIGFIGLLVLGPDNRGLAEKGKMKKCPFCKEFVHVDAVTCRYCGATDLETPVQPTPPGAVLGTYCECCRLTLPPGEAWILDEEFLCETCYIDKGGER